METKNRKFKEITGIVLVAILLLPAIPFRAKAAEKIMITVPFYSAGMWDMEWEFPCSDDYFLGSSDDFPGISQKHLWGLPSLLSGKAENLIFPISMRSISAKQDLRIFMHSDMTSQLRRKPFPV